MVPHEGDALHARWQLRHLVRIDPAIAVAIELAEAIGSAARNFPRADLTVAIDVVAAHEPAVLLIATRARSALPALATLTPALLRSGREPLLDPAQHPNGTHPLARSELAVPVRVELREQRLAKLLAIGDGLRITLTT